MLRNNSIRLYYNNILLQGDIISKFRKGKLSLKDTHLIFQELFNVIHSNKGETSFNLRFNGNLFSKIDELTDAKIEYRLILEIELPVDSLIRIQDGVYKLKEDFKFELKLTDIPYIYIKGSYIPESTRGMKKVNDFIQLRNPAVLMKAKSSIYNFSIAYLQSTEALQDVDCHLPSVSEEIFLEILKFVDSDIIKKEYNSIYARAKNARDKLKHPTDEDILSLVEFILNKNENIIKSYQNTEIYNYLIRIQNTLKDGSRNNKMATIDKLISAAIATWDQASIQLK